MDLFLYFYHLKKIKLVFYKVKECLEYQFTHNYYHHNFYYLRLHLHRFHQKKKLKCLKNHIHHSCLFHKDLFKEYLCKIFYHYHFLLVYQGTFSLFNSLATWKMLLRCMLLVYALNFHQLIIYLKVYEIFFYRNVYIIFFQVIMIVYILLLLVYYSNNHANRGNLIYCENILILS